MIYICVDKEKYKSKHVCTTYTMPGCRWRTLWVIAASIVQLTHFVIGVVVLATNQNATSLSPGLYWWCLGDTILAACSIACVGTYFWLETHPSTFETMPLMVRVCDPIPDLASSSGGWFSVAIFLWGIFIWPSPSASTPFQQHFPELWLYFTTVLWITFAQMAAATFILCMFGCFDCLCAPPDEEDYLDAFPVTVLAPAPAPETTTSVEI